MGFMLSVPLCEANRVTPYFSSLQKKFTSHNNEAQTDSSQLMTSRFC
jgi:hypothetical protein